MPQFELYKLQPKQQEFATSTAKYRLFGGAKGGGKSYAVRAEIVRQCLSRPNVRGLVLRRKLSEVRKNTILPMLAEIPAALYTHNEFHREVRFYQGSVLEYSFCKSAKDVEQFQGMEYDFIAIEELTHWKYLEWRKLMGSLRSTKSNVRPNFFASTNPGSIGHAWVKRLWLSHKFEDNERGVFQATDFHFIPARIWDNKVLMESDPSYMLELDALPDKLRRAFRDGDWNVFEGQFFPEFRDDLHIVAPFIPHNVRRRIFALDYGFTAPSAGLWLAEDQNLNIWCYRELYLERQTYGNLALRINAMTPEGEMLDGYYGDPAFVNKKNEGTGTTAFEEFSAHGISLIGANNNRLEGWNMIRECLQPYRDRNTGETRTILHVTSNCGNLIRTLPDLVHDAVKVDDVDTKGEDHAPDALRYGLMALQPRRGDLEDYIAMSEAIPSRRPLNAIVPGSQENFDNRLQKREDDGDNSGGFRSVKF